MKMLPDVTLVFLVKKNKNRISEICLALKKRGFGMGKWNGVGGKLMENESIENGAKREAKEEIGVDILSSDKVAINEFYFPNNPEWNQRVHVFICDKWKGEVNESEEMLPEWFSVGNIPYDKMWLDDRYWIPKILEGKKIEGRFVFENQEKIIEKEVNIIQSM